MGSSVDGAMPPGALDALRRHWGHRAFRPGQEEVVRAVLAGRDVLAVLPTGGGKSICYQVPALVQGGLTVVVSPLIALMQDQVAGLAARGVPATFITSQLSWAEAEQRWTDAEFGRYRLLYLAPERFETETFRARAERLPVRLLAVDEAHCISEWGPDFRPAYRRIAEGAALLGRPPIVALTATATPEVRHDIVEQLGLRDPVVLVRGFDRPNVVPSVFRTAAKREKLAEILAAVPGSGIVYTATRRGAEDWAREVAALGATAEAYHAGLPADARRAVQERWQAGRTRVVVATSAFGMGIDKPDVRFVVHVDLPPSLEAYYQEAGRAGRDGHPAYAVLLFAESDEAAARAFVLEGHPDARTVQAVHDTALGMAQVALGARREEPFVLDAGRVAEVVGCSPRVVRAAAEALVRAGVWESVRLPEEAALLRFLQPAAALRRYAEAQRNPALRAFVEGLLRTAPAAAFAAWCELDVRLLARRTGLPEGRVLQGLAFLAERDLLAVIPPGEGARYRMLEARARQAVRDPVALEAGRRRAAHRLEAMLAYARGEGCRRHHLLAYFGEEAPARCGRCDVCLGRHVPVVVGPADEPRLRAVLAHVEAGDPPEVWLAGEGLSRPRRLALADWLVREGYLGVDPRTRSYALTDRGRRWLGRSAQGVPGTRTDTASE